MKKEEIKFKSFVRKYKAEYYLGQVIGEDAFSELFGYLNPVIPFDELTIGEVQFLIEGELKNYKRKI